MLSKLVTRTLVPRTTNFVPKQAFRHDTMVSGPPRVKISSFEKGLHGIAIFFGITAYPAWVLQSATEWQKKEED